MPALLAVVGADFSARLQSGRLTLEVRAVPCAVQGDALMLRQAVGNLLDNAIDFAPAGSTIRMACAIEEGAVVIHVGNDGPHVPDYAQPRLFERFYSLPRPDGRKSTGLGLPFVREVMSLHKGTVAVDNTVDGVRAMLRLPRHQTSH